MFFNSFFRYFLYLTGTKFILAPEGEEFAIDDLEIFKNVAYIMAYHADNTISDNIDDWLNQFEMFSIYEVLPEILAIWGVNLITDIDSKKT